ncbi:arsenate reductase family protein [Selenomonas sp. F0473]|uniref:arsenate reductase family protein n=1 Tax=Selenomonas sp. F0473 TaxID=999423 RepID=UPI0025D2DE96|nr:arsenate reductase family protein [Selenomonas sp. F0473]
MAKKILFIGYPKCSTCQKAEKFLRAHGCDAPMRNIKAQPPTADELRAWHGRSGLPMKRFFNTSGMLYKELGLKDKLPAMTEDAQYALLATDGMLVKRPLLITPKRILTGFREAEWAELFA